MKARLLSKRLWSEVSPLAKKAARRRAAIAYCTDNKLGLKKGDVLIVDASDYCIKSGSTSAVLLADLYDGGVKLYSVPGLHAKVVSLGNAAIIGSANMSSNAESASRVEAALLTESPQVDQRPTFTRVRVECPQESLDSKITWRKFLQLAKEIDLPFTPTRTGSRLLKPDDAERLFNLWPR